MADAMTAWPMRVRFGAIGREPIRARLEPDAAARKAIARDLGLVGVDRLEADIVLSQWLDGAELSGRIVATVIQTCSITAEPLESAIDADFMLRVLPPGSDNAVEFDAAEIEIEAEAEDPPDVLETDVVDVSHYVVEHLALELDPFPRKPGAVFEPPVDPTSLSPFAALAKLRESPPDGD